MTIPPPTLTLTLTLALALGLAACGDDAVEDATGAADDATGASSGEGGTPTEASGADADSGDTGTDDGADDDGDGCGADAMVPTIAVSTASGPAPLTVTLRADASTGPIAAYTWDLGDGARHTGPTLDHTFSAGESTVTLTVVDAAGNTVSAETTIVVTAPAREAMVGDASGHPRLYFSEATRAAMLARIDRVPVLGSREHSSFLDYLLGINYSSAYGADWYRVHGGPTGCELLLGGKLKDTVMEYTGDVVSSGRYSADCLTTLALAATVDPDPMTATTSATAAIQALVRMATVWPSGGWDTAGNADPDHPDNYNGFGRWICGDCPTGASNLQNGELLYAVATAYDLLHGQMLPEQQAAVRALIHREATHLYLKSQDPATTWQGQTGASTQAINHAALGLAALTLMGDPDIDPAQTDAWIARAVDQCKQYMDTNFDADGLNLETLYSALDGLYYVGDFFRALRDLKGEDHFEHRDRILQKALRYQVAATPPSADGQLPNDTRDWSYVTNEALLVLAGAFGDGFGQWAWERTAGSLRPGSNGHPWKSQAFRSQSDLLRTLFLHDDRVPVESPAGRQPLASVYTDVGRALFRTDWEDNRGVFLGVEAGLYGIGGVGGQGNYIMTAYGEQLTFNLDSAPWGLNTVAYDAVYQKSPADPRERLAETRSSLLSGPLGHVRYDLTPAYTLASAAREFVFVQPRAERSAYVVVLDHLVAPAEAMAPLSYRFHMAVDHNRMPWEAVDERHYRAAVKDRDVVLNVYAAAPAEVTLTSGEANLNIGTTALTARYVTLLFPTDLEHPLPVLARIVAGAAEGVQVGDDRILYNPDGGSFSDGGLTTDATVLIRQLDGGILSALSLVDMTSATLDDEEILRASAPIHATVSSVGPTLWLSSASPEAEVTLRTGRPDATLLLVVDDEIVGPLTSDADGRVTMDLDGLSANTTRRVQLIPASAGCE